MKGKLIVIDGTDGSGKGTQLKLLKENLEKKGYPVEVADFPRYGERSAALVEDYLSGKFGSPEEVGPYRGSLFYALDRYAASFQIKQWLDSGKIVISNRYVSANMGHQAGKIRNVAERDSYLEWLENLEFGICNIPKPDLNILLYVPPLIGQYLVDSKGSRAYIGGKRRDIHEADPQHLLDAAEAFKYVADKYKWPTIVCVKQEAIDDASVIDKIEKGVFKAADFMLSVEKINSMILEKVFDVIRSEVDLRNYS